MDYPFKNLNDWSGGGTDPANDAAKDAISGFIHGSTDINREYGPDHAWTAEMKKHEHMKTIRNEIRGKIKSYCAGQTSGIIGMPESRPFLLNQQSALTNARIFISDILARIGVARSVHSTGSVGFQYKITSIDCSKCTAKTDMDARDTLSIGSATRVLGTNTSLLDVLAAIGNADAGPTAWIGKDPPPNPLDGNPYKWNNSKPNSPGNNINLHWYWYETVGPQ